MDQVSIANNQCFNVITRLLDTSNLINQQVCKLTTDTQFCTHKRSHVLIKSSKLDGIGSLTSSLIETELKSLIETTTELVSILEDDSLERDEFKKLLVDCDELDQVLRLIKSIDDNLDDPENYEQAVEAIVQVDKLYRDHGSHARIFETLHEEAEKRREFLIANLSYKLETAKTDGDHSVQKVVNNLLRCGNFSYRDLRLRYLQARDNWFVDACEDNSASFDNVVSVYSKGLPMIFTEYKNLFADQEESEISLKFLSKDNSTKEGAAIINSWLLLKTSIFISSLEVYLKDVNHSGSLTPTMISDTIEKCFKLTNWLATIGFDFGHQLRPLFSRAILDELKRSVEKATIKFESSFAATISKSIESLLLPVDDEILRISNINSAGKELPKSIEHYPIFKVYCLYLIDSLRWLQTTKDTITPIPLCCETYAALNASLIRVIKALAITLNMDNNAHHPILTKIAISLVTQVLGYVAAHCEDLFPEKVILNALGLTKTDFKTISREEPEKLHNFRLNIKQIVEPLRGTMRALVETVED